VNNITPRNISMISIRLPSWIIICLWKFTVPQLVEKFPFYECQRFISKFKTAWFDHLNSINWGIQVIELLIMLLFLVSCYFLLCPNILFSPLVSGHPQAMSIPWHDRASFTPIQSNTQHYSSVCIIIHYFMDRKLEDKRSWTEWQQAFPEFNVINFIMDAILVP
jgi:hypothetical protein